MIVFSSTAELTKAMNTIQADECLQIFTISESTMKVQNVIIRSDEPVTFHFDFSLGIFRIAEYLSDGRG